MAGSRPAASPRDPYWLGWTGYPLAFLALMLLLPGNGLDPEVRRLVPLVGAIAAWRYGWQTIHQIRALIYRRRTFPRLRAMADTVDAAETTPHVYFLITSYRMTAEANLSAYRALFHDVIDFGAPATIVAAITDGGDEMLIERLFASMTPPDRVSLILMRQAGTRKRDAMAAGLRAISRRNPAPGSAVVLMDGDVVPRPGTLARSLPFFGLMPDLGALTVDNDVGDSADGAWARAWYGLRFAQRHMLMCSVSLSRRVLVLTGRFSVFRAEIATDPSFIDIVEHDHLDHWRLGRIRFLTGDDKSTWFWLLQRRWKMLYLPDVSVTCIESLPSGSFLSSSIRLMQRWFGNMLRNNGRSIALGPRRVGFFTWWCLVDQRLSIWTTLSGPTFAVLISLSGRPEAIPMYLIWVMFSRLAQTGVIRLHRRHISPYYPVLLFYTQVIGSIVKVYMSFRLDRQSWTRQGIRTVGDGGFRGLPRNALTIYLNVLAVSAFVFAAALIAEVLPLPGAGMSIDFSQRD